MSRDDDVEAELRRRFQSAISGAELSDLRQLAGDLTMIGDRAALRSVRPELRRSPLDEVAFDWTDSHLHRFSLGGGPFDPQGQLFLCRYDVEEGEVEDDGGIGAHQVRLDETLQVPGDVLNYVYDYGDHWGLTLRLEEVLSATPDAPSAVATGGRRAAPTEDSGAGTDLASIAMSVDDPAHFDLDELNAALRAPYFVLREFGMDQRLVDVLNRLRYTRTGEDLAQRVVTVAMDRTDPDSGSVEGALAAHRWFLDRAKGGGIELTAAGYLKPDDVEAASRVVPAMGDWIGKSNREVHCAPPLEFRESLRTMGLLRKHKGRLLLTRAGATAQRNPMKLWAHLRERLIPAKGSDFETVATLILLAYAATYPTLPSPGSRWPSLCPTSAGATATADH